MGFMQESSAKSRINVNFRNALIAVCLSSTAWGAAALSLGNARGAVVLGRSVDLAFDIHTDPGQTLESACITAKMRSGDNPVADGRVRVTPLPQVPGRTPAVRVQSSVPAVEPVLTVELQAGCTGKIARTYTFLADLPDTVASSARPIAIPLAGGQKPQALLSRVRPLRVRRLPSAALLPPCRWPKIPQPPLCPGHALRPRPWLRPLPRRAPGPWRPWPAKRSAPPTRPLRPPRPGRAW